MKPKIPRPKKFDDLKFQSLINSLTPYMDGKKFEKLCQPIVSFILTEYEHFERVIKGPNFQGTPFDFLGFKAGRPYIIEFKGSLESFNTPGETQKNRLKEILAEIKGLHIALIQVKLRKAEYRMFYYEQMPLLFEGEKAPIQPIIDWVKKHII